MAGGPLTPPPGRPPCGRALGRRECPERPLHEGPGGRRQGGWAGAPLPLLARCRMVSICSPDNFAFFMADVARGHPDKLGARQETA